MKSCGPAAGRREENRKTGIWVGKENPMDNDKTFEEMYSEITPKLIELSLMCERTDRIDPGLYEKYDVKPNYVAACISRARKHLKNDRKFVNAMR